tara:strand:- start:687 stop:953 length:267 start_codon:yes stop_codon:yes gene_type:complete
MPAIRIRRRHRFQVFPDTPVLSGRAEIHRSLPENGHDAAGDAVLSRRQYQVSSREKYSSAAMQGIGLENDSMCFTSQNIRKTQENDQQ